jgi:hypothetical protein
MALAEAMPAPRPRGGWRALFAFGESRTPGALLLLPKDTTLTLRASSTAWIGDAVGTTVKTKPTSDVPSHLIQGLEVIPNPFP